MGIFLSPNLTDTILAQNRYLTLDTWASKLNNNIMLVGASGHGKTRHFVKPNIMQMNCNYVISDPKGKLIYELGSMLERNGYNIKVLNLVDLTHSDTYNPFYYIKEDIDVFKIVNYLIENLASGSERKSDPFWILAAQSLISACCFYLVSECNKEDQNFATVITLLRCAKVGDGLEDVDSTLDVMMKDLKERNPESIAVKQYDIFKAVANASTTASCILTECMVYLQYFNLTEYINLTSSDTLELQNLSQDKTAMFVIISDTDRSKNWLAGLFYSQLFDILCNQENKTHIRFILDDFVCTGKIPDFDYKMAMIRSRNISCVVVVQDEAQLEKEYGNAAQGIITNCDSYVFLGASNIDICDKVAHRLGDRRITGANIRAMDDSSCVVIFGNQGGIYKKYNLKNHPRYNEIADDEASPLRYNLEGKHTPSPILCPGTRRIQRRPGAFVSLKGSLFDSFEEEYLFGILNSITNLTIGVHEQLRDLFVSEDITYSKKLSYMHCDFVVRDTNFKVMFGIEIDGKQHLTDTTQIVNDHLKNRFFEANNIPLLRYSASAVRESANLIIIEVIEKATKIDGLEHTFKGPFPAYKSDARRAQFQELKEALILAASLSRNMKDLGRLLSKDYNIKMSSINNKVCVQHPSCDAPICIETLGFQEEDISYFFIDDEMEIQPLDVEFFYEQES